MIAQLGYLFTAHGTLLRLDPGSRALRHAAATQDSDCRWQLSRERWIITITPAIGAAGDQGESGGADEPARWQWEQVSPLEYAARIGDHYVCAEPNGDVTESRTDRKEWETFAFLSADAAQLGAICETYRTVIKGHLLVSMGHLQAYAEDLRHIVLAESWPLLPAVLRDEVISQIISLYRQIGDLATLQTVLLELCPRMAIPALTESRTPVLETSGRWPARRSSAHPLALRLRKGRRISNETVRLQDAHVIGHDWFVYSSSVGALRHSDGYHHRYLSEAGADSYDVIVPEASLRIREPVILLGGYPNYYHNMLDFYINIYYYFAELSGGMVAGSPPPAPTFLVRAPDQPFERELLRFLGIDASRCLELPDGEVAFCDRLVMLPQTITSWGHLRDVRPIQWLSRIARQAGRLPRHRRIYISREKAERRRIENELEVQSLMTEFGISILHLEDLGVQDQLGLFAHARVVIGLHGAGLANIAACQPDTLVIEITPSDGGFPDYFSHLATGLGRPLARFAIPGFMHDQADYHVDCGRLRRFLRDRMAEIDA